MSEADREARRRAAAAAEPWRFAIRPDGLGLLTMPSWSVYASRWNWQAFIDAAIDRLISERARGLVVDLRGNEGGTECAWHLIERLIAGETPRPRYLRRTRYRRVPTDLAGFLETWDRSFFDWGDAASGPRPDGFYDLAPLAAGPLLPRGDRFAGPVTVLVDAACSSATFQFAEAVRAARIARLVGSPTGGDRRGINGGGFFFLRLPETGVEVDLPVIGYFPPRPQPDRGIVPHVTVMPTAGEIAAGQDRALAVAARETLSR